MASNDRKKSRKQAELHNAIKQNLFWDYFTNSMAFNGEREREEKNREGKRDRERERNRRKRDTEK